MELVASNATQMYINNSYKFIQTILNNLTVVAEKIVSTCGEWLEFEGSKVINYNKYMYTLRHA